MARPTFKPTEENRRYVEQLSAFGIPHAQIVGLIFGSNGKPISEGTLRKYFSAELEVGTTKANAKVASTLYNKAVKGDTTSCIFWLKTRAGWRETSVVKMEIEQVPDEEIDGRIAELVRKAGTVRAAD